MKKGMDYVKADGGGDIPEDCDGGYDLALDDYMDWRKNSLKIIIHLDDERAHIKKFSDRDSKQDLPEYEIGLVNNIKNCAKKKINIFWSQIGKESQKSFS